MGEVAGIPALVSTARPKLVDVDLVRTHRLRAPLDVCSNPSSPATNMEDACTTFSRRSARELLDHGELGALVWGVETIVERRLSSPANDEEGVNALLEALLYVSSLMSSVLPCPTHGAVRLN